MSRVIGRVFETIFVVIFTCIAVCIAVFLESMRVLFVPIFSIVAAKICLVVHVVIAACIGMIGELLFGREYFHFIFLSSLAVTVTMHLLLSLTVIAVFIRQQWQTPRYSFEAPWFSQPERWFYTLAWQFFFPITYVENLSSGRTIHFAC